MFGFASVPVSSLSQVRRVGSTQRDTNSQPPKCQKCLQSGHWSYQCNKPAVYQYRPSRTRQLSKGKPSEPASAAQLQMEPVATTELVDQRKGLADRILKEKEKQRSLNRSAKRSKRDASPSSSESDSDSSESGSDSGSGSGSDSDSSSSLTDSDSDSSSDSDSQSDSNSDSDSDSDSSSSSSSARHNSKSRKRRRS
eukprot:jgi/Hompol1/5696/HPOL_004669-RA